MKAKPFVKWAGGKGSLLKQLEAMLPEDFDDRKEVTYIEPFVGGGAMLFHMLNTHKNIKRVIINDINKDLIKCYEMIRDTPRDLIKRLSEIEKQYYSVASDSRDKVYYAYRESFNEDELTAEQRAAIFIFLNHTCFNGLYRENRSGGFNVPFGRYKKPVICNKDLIMSIHSLFKSIHIEIYCGDYSNIAKHLSKKCVNFVYFDPPYRPLNEKSNFNDYNKSGFGDNEQRLLKEFCDKISKRNCQIMLSNSDSMNEDGSSFFEELFETNTETAIYNIERVFAPRYINAFAVKRQNVNEVLLRNYR